MATTVPLRISLMLVFFVCVGRQPSVVCCANEADITALGTLRPMDLQLGWGEAVIQIEPATVPSDGVFRLLCGLRLRSMNQTLYNPFLRSECKLPAQLVISSVDGKVRRDLLQQRDAAVQQTDLQAWVAPSGLSFVGREFLVRLSAGDSKSTSASNTVNLDLPPGEYYVQAIYDYWLLPFWFNKPGYSGPRPPNGTGDEPHPRRGFSKAQMEEPLAISGPVKLTITERSNVAAKSAFTLDKSQSRALVRAELSPLNEPAKLGEWTTVPIRIVNQSTEELEFYAPYHAPALGYNGHIKLAILNSDGAYLGNLWSAFSLSYAAPMHSDWLKVPPGGITETHFQFKPGLVPETPDAPLHKLLPGKYQLELRIHSHFISRRPAGFERVLKLGPQDSVAATGFKDALRIHTTPEQLDWQRTFPGKEICRSNRVELEIRPRTGD